MGDDVRMVGVALAREPAEDLSDVKWLRRADARRICGIGKDILDDWVLNGRVEAHKLHAGKNGTVIFAATDILKAIRESPRYVPGAGACPT